MDPKSYVLPPPATPPRRPPKRSNQLVGVHFESPKRRRPMRKDSALVVRPGLAQRENELTSRLDTLLGKNKGRITSIGEDFQPPESCGNDAGVMGEGEDAEQPARLAMPENVLDPVVESSNEKQAPSRRVAPSLVQRLYDNWLALIPTLEDAYLSYMQHAQGRLGRQSQGEPRHCVSRRCVAKSSPVQCLYADCTYWSALQRFYLANLFISRHRHNQPRNLRMYHACAVPHPPRTLSYISNSASSSSLNRPVGFLFRAL